MELKEFKYMLTIAEEGSFSKAAERLYMSQSNLSQFVSNYEGTLHTKLFKRTASGVTPTPSGEVYLRHARQISLAYSQMQNELFDIEDLKSGRILFGIASLRGTFLMPPILRHFLQMYPNIKVEFVEANTSILEDMVEKNMLDVAVLATPLKLGHTHIETIAREEVFIVANKHHPVLQYARIGEGGPDRPWIRIEDAARFPFILCKRDTLLRTIADHQFEVHGIIPNVLYDDLSAEFAMALANEGLGLAFMHQSCVPKGNDLVYLSIGKEGVWRDLMIAYPPHGYRSNAVRAFTKVIRERIDSISPVPSELPDWDS